MPSVAAPRCTLLLLARGSCLDLASLLIVMLIVMCSVAF